MSRQQSAAVFERRGAFEHALGQIADDGKNSHGAAEWNDDERRQAEVRGAAQAISATMNRPPERRPPKSCRDSPAARACAGRMRGPQSTRRYRRRTP